MSDTHKKYNETITMVFPNEKWGKGNLVGSIAENKTINLKAGSMILVKKAMQKVDGQWVPKLSKKNEPYYFIEIIEPKTEQTPQGSSSFDDWL